MSRFTNILHCGLLVVLPLATAIAVPVCSRAWYDHSIRTTPMHAAVYECTADLFQKLYECGALGTTFFVLGNLMSFGALIVTCWVMSYFWNEKRVYCVLFVGIGIAVSFWLYKSPYLIHWKSVISSDRPPRLSDYAWLTELFRYDIRALLGIPLGMLLAMLPIFKPSPRYWLRRGRCPKCHYDLAGEVDRGCSECGWNRFGETAGQEADLLLKRTSIRRITMALSITWTVLVLGVLGIYWQRLMLAMPSVTAITPHGMRLSHPQSQAYADVVFDCDIQRHSGWFDPKGELTRIKWSATFRRNQAPSFEKLAPLPAPSRSQKKIDAAIQGEYVNLARIVVDQISQTAVCRYQNTEFRHDGSFGATQFAAWLAKIFPDASPQLLEEEVIAILYAVEQWKTARPVQRHTIPTIPPDTQAFNGRGGSHRNSDWPVRPKAYAIAIISLGIVALWLYGIFLCWRWARCRL